MSDSVYVVLCNCPDEATAIRIAERLVREGHGACVNILAGTRSVYRWQGRIETAQEHTLLIKTTATSYSALEQAIVALHPDEVPEIIALPVTMGLRSYLEWIAENVG